MEKQKPLLPPSQRNSDPENRMGELQAILLSREGTYGDFSDIAALSTTMRHAWENVLYSKPIFDKTRISLVTEAATMILHKLARIANGDSFSRDSWMDIAGYAMRTVMEMDRLAAEFCEEQRKLEEATKERKNSNECN